MIEVFHDPSEDPDVSGYRYWLKHNPNGYVIDRHWESRKNPQSCKGMLHRASCRRYIQNEIAGALSDGRYKACSNDKDALFAWARYVHPNDMPEKCDDPRNGCKP